MHHHVTDTRIDYLSSEIQLPPFQALSYLTMFSYTYFEHFTADSDLRRHFTISDVQGRVI